MNIENQLEVEANSAEAAPPESAEPATGPSAEALPVPVDVEAVARDAVRQTLAALGITADGELSKLRELTSTVAVLAGLPEEFRSRNEAMFASVLDRIEDKKGHFAFNRLRRLFLDLLSFHDMIRDLEAGAGEEGSHRSNYENLREQLLQILALSDVTPIVCQVGTPFAPQQHRVVRVIPVEDEALDGCIESVAREGFVYGPFVVRPAEVVVQKRAAASTNRPQ